MYVCISWAFNVEGRPLTALLLFFFFFRFFFFFLILQLHFSTSLASLHQRMVRSWSSNCLLGILKGGGELYENKKNSQSQTHLLCKVMGRGFMLSCYNQNCTGNIISFPFLFIATQSCNPCIPFRSWLPYCYNQKGGYSEKLKKVYQFSIFLFQTRLGFQDIFQFSKIHRIWKNILSEYFVLPLGSVCVVKSFIFPLVRSQYSTSV